jgi:hypothetical protein
MELSGSWRKMTEERCAEVYPDVLELNPDGTYRGTMDPSSPYHPVWDVGSYAPADADGVVISTANDAQIRYDVSQQGDTLTFTDARGCQVRYRRQP